MIVMLTAKEAFIKLKEVRRLEKEKGEKKLNEMVQAELKNVEHDIESAIAMSQSDMVYTFIERNRTIQMRVVLALEHLGYDVDFVKESSSIIIGWSGIAEL
jgi:hypothetical protein